MATRNRSNPLALAVLICLYESPMHPYEIAATLRHRNKHESVRLNYGSLYAIVGSLEKRCLITPLTTERTGRLPERTVYELTPAGAAETHDWLAELVSVPVKEYPEFEAGLSFLAALHPDEAITLLNERAKRLELIIAQTHAAFEMMAKEQLPRLFLIEEEYELALRETELAFVLRLVGQIADGTLDGVGWWRQTHENRASPITYPAGHDPHPGNAAHRYR